MSTKIYSAVRIPVERYSEFLGWVKQHTLPRQCEIYQAATKDLAESVKDPWELRQKAIDLLYTFHNHNNRLFGPQTPCLWAQVYIESPWVYFIFIGQTWAMTDDDDNFIPGSLPEYAEEYAYWNNVDPPEWASDYKYNEDGTEGEHGPGYQRWEKRAETWDRILSPSVPKTIITFWGWDTKEGGSEAAFEIEAEMKIGIFAPKE